MKICMKCQILFAGKNKKNTISFLSAEFAKSMVKVKDGQHNKTILQSLRIQKLHSLPHAFHFKGETNKKHKISADNIF